MVGQPKRCGWVLLARPHLRVTKRYEQQQRVQCNAFRAALDAELRQTSAAAGCFRVAAVSLDPPAVFASLSTCCET